MRVVTVWQFASMRAMLEATWPALREAARTRPCDLLFSKSMRYSKLSYGIDVLDTRHEFIIILPLFNHQPLTFCSTRG